MWVAQISDIPDSVISRYRFSFQQLKWRPVGGGYSGATVWRGDDASGSPRYALKCWPPTTTSFRLNQIHAWMRQASSLSFVPQLLNTAHEQSFVHFQDRLWEVSSWLPGTAHVAIDREKVLLACESVAELHAVWKTSNSWAPCPGLSRRLEVLTLWLAHSNPMPTDDFPELAVAINRACVVLQREAPGIVKALLPWSTVSFLLHPCIRDLRGEHVLFLEHRVGGIVDYGAMEVDSPALDLARMLGDLAGDNDELFSDALQHYRECNPAFTWEDEFVRLLDRAGTLCSLLGWFARLASRQLPVPIETTRQRLIQLIMRAEHFRSI